MICTICGHEASVINTLDDENKVCNGCLDALFFKCSVCKKYMYNLTLENLWLKDGKLICEHCRSELNDDDIVLD